MSNKFFYAIVLSVVTTYGGDFDTGIAIDSPITDQNNLQKSKNIDFVVVQARGRANNKIGIVKKDSKKSYSTSEDGGVEVGTVTVNGHNNAPITIIQDRVNVLSVKK